MTRKITTILAGFTLAGLLLGAGPAPEPTHHHAPISTDGKDWTAPIP